MIDRIWTHYHGGGRIWCFTLRRRDAAAAGATFYPRPGRNIWQCPRNANACMLLAFLTLAELDRLPNAREAIAQIHAWARV